MRLPKTEYLCCRHIAGTARIQKDVMAFEVIHPEIGLGLDCYLKGQALEDETASTMRTYLVYWTPTEECVGYFL